MKIDSGLIFRIAADAEIAMRGSGDKRTCLCPFHDDRNRSAFLSANNVFYCSRCTPGKGLTAKEFCERLGLNWSSYFRGTQQQSRAITRPKPLPKPDPEFSAAQATEVWRLAKARARNDDLAHLDHATYAYAQSRQSVEGLELGAFGVLGRGMSLPPAIMWWVANGYTLVSPLWSLDGTIVGIQGRSINGRTPRVMTPKGCPTKGTVFADSRGLALLRGENVYADAVVFGEGLTDAIALAIASPCPVITTPGTGTASSSVGLWARGKRVFLALDWDEAGTNAQLEVNHALYRAGASHVMRVVWPRPAKDASDVLAQRGAEGLYTFIIDMLGTVTE